MDTFTHCYCLYVRVFVQCTHNKILISFSSFTCDVGQLFQSFNPPFLPSLSPFPYFPVSNITSDLINTNETDKSFKSALHTTNCTSINNNHCCAHTVRWLLCLVVIKCSRAVGMKWIYICIVYECALFQLKLNVHNARRTHIHNNHLCNGKLAKILFYRR